MADTSQVRIQFSRQYTDSHGTVITYVDSLYFSPSDPNFNTALQFLQALASDPNTATPDVIASMEDQRYNSWVQQFTAPQPAPAPATYTVFTRFAFLSLFTSAELAGILASTDAGVKNFLFMFQAANDVDTSNPSTVGGVNYLAQIGLITSARASQILASTTTVPTT